MTVTAGDPYPERELTQGLGPRGRILQRYKDRTKHEKEKKKKFNEMIHDPLLYS